MVYLVNGQLNLHKSGICGTDFIRYLHDLRHNYKLSEYGSVLGMDHYGVLSKTAREKQQQESQLKKRNENLILRNFKKEYDQIMLELGLGKVITRETQVKQ